MAHSLVNSAPMVAGVSTPVERREFAKYVYRLSRGLIGNELADQLQFPSAGASFVSVKWFRALELWKRYVNNLLPGRASSDNFSRFTGLLETSLFDEAGIRYTLPDHVCAEESTKW